MRVCMILEGSYPYVFGGVSSWMHQYIQAMPDTEFVLWCIAADAKDAGKFKFKLPGNVVEVEEVFLDKALSVRLDRKKQRKQFSDAQKEELEKLFMGKPLKWDVLFELFHTEKMNPVSMLMSPHFLELLAKLCEQKFPYVSFAEFFHTIRSMLLPELYLLTGKVPEADIYHATATGYSGLLGSLAKWKNNKPFILTEHGIYTREREEELLRADWVLPFFRKQWIDLFYCFSACAYAYADKVTALFSRANLIQQEIGCPPQKLCVIENGVHYERFCDIPLKAEDGSLQIGAVVRLARIKDIKTMIYAFSEVKSQVPEAKLYIMGDVDDKAYAEECRMLIEQLAVKDIILTGVVNVQEYLPKMDFTILTSISEGQPLSVLESMAAGRPLVTTDVGCCRELLEGHDEFGPAGFIVPPMHKDMLAQAMIRLCGSKRERLAMGRNGRARVEKYYTHELSMEKYRALYQEVSSHGRDRI